MQPTQEQIEYIKSWTPKCKDNFPLFCEKMVGVRLNSGQARAWNEVKDTFFPTNLYLTGNRWGKTVYESLRHLWKNYYKLCGPGINLQSDDWHYMEYTTLNVAPASELTKIMMETILQLARGEYPIFNKDTGRFTRNDSRIKYFVDLDGLNNYKKIPEQGPYEIRYANKSKTRFFTLGQTHGDTIQGRAFAYATYDEFGRSKNPEKEIDDILPRLQQYNGELDIITTPDLENEEAYAYLVEKKELAKEGQIGWRFIGGNSKENEYLPRNDMDSRLSGMSEAKKKQIIAGELALIGANYYDPDKVVRMFNESLFIKVGPKPNHAYYVGMDTAGEGKDFWAVTVVDVSRKPFQIVRTYYDKFNQPMYNAGITKNILDEYIEVAGLDNVTLVMDYTNEAGAIYFRDFIDYKPKKYRFGQEKKTSKSTKADLTDMLRRCINEGMIISPHNTMLKNQLVGYKGPTNDEKQTTDALMSCALAVFYPYKEHIADTQFQSIITLG